MSWLFRMWLTALQSQTGWRFKKSQCPAENHLLTPALCCHKSWIWLPPTLLLLPAPGTMLGRRLVPAWDPMPAPPLQRRARGWHGDWEPGRRRMWRGWVVGLMWRAWISDLGLSAGWKWGGGAVWSVQLDADPCAHYVVPYVIYLLNCGSTKTFQTVIWPGFLTW